MSGEYVLQTLVELSSSPTVVVIVFAFAVVVVLTSLRVIAEGFTREVAAKALADSIKTVIEDRYTLNTLETSYGKLAKNLPAQQRRIVLAIIDLLDPFTATDSLPDDVLEWAREIVDGVPSEEKQPPVGIELELPSEQEETEARG